MIEPQEDGGGPATTELLVSARRGDRKALDALFERYLPRVRRIVALRAGKRLREVHELDDLVQDAALRVFRSLQNLETLSAPALGNYVAHCVQNELCDQLRAATAKKRGGSRKPPLAQADLLLSSIIDPGAQTPSWHARAREIEERVEQALLSLKPHHREAIVLRYLCGFEYEDLTRVMGFKSEAHARMAVSRAVSRLKDVLGAE
jgi:RNA polymerase sigma-70 factor (ECF subfamily)